MSQPYIAKVNFPEKLQKAREPDLMDLFSSTVPEIAKAMGRDKDEVVNPYPFKHDELMLVIGELENAPGFIAVANVGGRVFWGITEKFFTKLTPEEVIASTPKPPVLVMPASVASTSSSTRTAIVFI